MLENLKKFADISAKIELIQPDEQLTDASNKVKGYAEFVSPTDPKVIFELYDALKHEHVGFTPLIIFGDIGQCQYTNMHAMSDFYFELDEDDESLRVDGKSDYHAAEFKNMLALLDKNRLKIDQIHGKMNYSSDDETR
ncbi:hypothetical protein U5B43_01700 [Campylobacter sp. 9BO]|uniref:hypothetical protein n=1 Tax=Campylobacter sp. 9BO TaxID=3424759 RepID=UPI003D33FD35